MTRNRQIYDWAVGDWSSYWNDKEMTMPKQNQWITIDQAVRIVSDLFDRIDLEDLTGKQQRKILAAIVELEEKLVKYAD